MLQPVFTKLHLLSVLCNLGLPKLQFKATKVNYKVSVTGNTHR